jgi:hypothetical protein
MPPTYRERLRIEGAVLAGSAALACVVLLAGVPAASDQAPSTIGQLAFVAVLLLVLVPVITRRTLAGARPIESGEPLTGKPTALWKPPLVLIVLGALFVVPGALGVGAAGWDAGLRIAGGCLLVGLAQSLLIERLVAADEARSDRRYVRVGGSSATRGTKLGFLSCKQV